MNNINDKLKNMPSKSDVILEKDKNSTDKSIVCSTCKTKLKREFEFCPTCGISTAEVLCTKCSNSVELQFDFCPKCGANLK